MKLANMVWGTCSYDCTAGAELTAPGNLTLQVREKGAEPATRLRVKGTTSQATAVQVKLASPPEDAHKEIARIPVLINSKDLNRGDVLFVFQAVDEDKNERQALRPRAPSSWRRS